MRIGVFALTNAGHLNPFVCVLQRLAERGHTLHVVSFPDDVAGRLSASGVRATSFHPRLGSGRPAALGGDAAYTARQGNPRWAAKFFSLAFLDRLPQQVEAAREQLRSFKPDVALVNACYYAGGIAAELEGVPWVSVSTNFVPVGDPAPESIIARTFKDIEVERTRAVSPFGVPMSFKLSDMISPWASTVFLPEGVLGGGTGYALPMGMTRPKSGQRGDETAFPWERLGTRDVAYVCFGSAYRPPLETYRAIALALHERGLFVVLAGSSELVSASASWLPPEQGVTVAWAPQLALLERCRLMVNHGGANSVVECLAAGKPMLSLPLAYDHEMNAALMARAGVGRQVSEADLTSGGLAGAIDAVLDPSSGIAAAARATAERLRASDGALALSDLVERRHASWARR